MKAIRALAVHLFLFGLGALSYAQEGSIFTTQRDLFLSYQTALERCQSVLGKISEADIDCASRASNLLHNELDRLRKTIGPDVLKQLFNDGYTKLGQAYAEHFMGCGMGGAVLLEDGRVFLCDPGDPANLYSPREKEKSRVSIMLLRLPHSNAPAILVDNVLIRGKMLVQQQ